MSRAGWKGRGGVVLALAMLVAATAWVVGEEPGATADPVRAVVLPYLNMMPFHIAAEEGYFDEQRLDVEFIRVGRTQEIMASLASGDVDAAGGMLTVNELNLAASGARVRLVASLGELMPDACTYSAVVARRELLEAGALADPARLRELTFDADLLIPFGYWLDELLLPLGLGTDDLDIVNLPSPAAIESFRRGALDVTIETEPFLSMYLESEEAVVWEPVQSLVPDYPIAVVMFGPTLLDERREVGERLAVALLRAVRRYAEGKTERNLEIVAAATGLDQDLLSRACWPSFRAGGRLDPGAFLGYQQWSVALGLVDRVLSDHEIFDPHFLDHAGRELEP